MFDYACCHNGRIWVGYDPTSVHIECLEKADQFFNFCVFGHSLPFLTFLTGVYAKNEEVDQERLWCSLRIVGMAISGEPWVLMGDFNVCRYVLEMRGGNIGLSLGMRRFNTFLSEFLLHDLVFSGPTLTWNNKHSGEDSIFRKLDRVIVNDLWLSRFPDSKAIFLHAGALDHSPAIISLFEHIQPREGPFRFLNHLADHPLFLDKVRFSWGMVVCGYPMYRLVCKLKAVKGAIKTLNQAHGHVTERVIGLRDKLYQVQQSLIDNPSDSDLRQKELI